MSDPNPLKIFLGSKTKRVCCFCDESKSEKFKQECDAIPAGFGNRRFFTKEECDKCNQEYGMKTENELLAWLLSARVFGRIPRRQGERFAKIKAPKGEAYITSDSKGIKFVEKTGDSSLLHSVSQKDKSLLITHYRPPFRPVSAIRSLLRSAWMIMDTQSRRRHRYILKIIKDELQIAPAEISDFFVPGGSYPIVSIVIWEKTNKDFPGADLLIALTVGNTVLIWGSPDLEKLSHISYAAPPILSMPPEYEKPSGLIRSFKNDERIIPKTITQRLRFSKFEKVTVKKEVLESNKFFEEFKVRSARAKEIDVFLDLGDSKINLGEAQLIFEGNDAFGYLIRLTGAPFVGSVAFFYPHGAPKELKGHFGLTPAKFKISEIKSLLEKISERNLTNSSLLICNKGSTKPMLNFIAEPIIEFVVDSIDPLLVDQIDLINIEFKVDFSYPAKFNINLYRSLEILAGGIKYGKFKMPLFQPNFKIVVAKPMAEKLVHCLKTDEIFVVASNSLFQINGHALDAETYKMGFSKPKLKQNLTVLEDEIVGMADGEFIEIEIEEGELIFEFPKWVKKPTLTPFSNAPFLLKE